MNKTTNTGILSKFIKEIPDLAPDSQTNATTSTLEFIHQVDSTLRVYLYPCLIEYSLISLAVFFIMWRNVGKSERRSSLRFGQRHIFTVDCSRASRGLITGGIILLLTILTLIPAYLLNNNGPILITHITELALLIVALFAVCMSLVHITKLYYNENVHVDTFDRNLILITTTGDFAYSFFGLFASIFIDRTVKGLPPGLETSVRIIAIFQTFFQSGFILDALKRRVRTKEDIRTKLGRESITALLLTNLGECLMNFCFTLIEFKFLFLL